MQRLVKVDGKVRTDSNYPAGFMDVIQIPKTEEHFRLIYDTKGRFVTHRITKVVPRLTVHCDRRLPVAGLGCLLVVLPLHGAPSRTHQASTRLRVGSVFCLGVLMSLHSHLWSSRLARTCPETRNSTTYKMCVFPATEKGWLKRNGVDGQYSAKRPWCILQMIVLSEYLPSV
jgi:hypothetical protein